MNIRKKTPAELENQVARFSLDSVDTHPTPLFGKSDYRTVGQLVSKLLELGPENLVRDEEFRGENPEITDEDIAATLRDYTQFLADRNSDPELRQYYKTSAQMVDSYSANFKEIIAECQKGELESLDDSKDRPPFIIRKDGQEYAVRSLDAYGGFRQVDKHLQAALRVQDIPRLEHIEAISYVDNVTVAPRIPGEQMIAVVENGELRKVSMSQIEEIYDSMRAANIRGVGFDGYGENLLYDPDRGFSVVDMGLVDNDVYRSAADTLYIHTAQLMEARSGSADMLHATDRFGDLVAAVIGNDSISPAVKRRFVESQEALQNRIREQFVRESLGL